MKVFRLDEPILLILLLVAFVAVIDAGETRKHNRHLLVKNILGAKISGIYLNLIRYVIACKNN